jgi:hypothetical protein
LAAVDDLWDVWTFSAVSIEKLPSGKYRAVVRHAGAKGASEAVATVAEARMLEAKLKLAMGGSKARGERHTVGEVVAGYIADGASRLSPGTLDFYRKGLAALPEVFRDRAVTEVTPLALDSVYGDQRAEGASEHKLQKVHRLLSAAFNRAVRYGWMVANRACRRPSQRGPGRHRASDLPGHDHSRADADHVAADGCVPW